MCKECQAEILCVEAEDAALLFFRSAPLALRATSPSRGRHARQGRQRKHTKFMPTGFVHFAVAESINDGNSMVMLLYGKKFEICATGEIGFLKYLELIILKLYSYTE